MPSGGARESRDDVSALLIGLNKGMIGQGSTDLKGLDHCARDLPSYPIIVNQVLCKRNDLARGHDLRSICQLLLGCLSRFPLQTRPPVWLPGKTSRIRSILH